MANDDLPPTVILEPGDMVTGVRGWSETEVVLTGTIKAEVNGAPVTTAMIYLGPIAPTDPAGIFAMQPTFDQAGTPVGSTLYGPDTWVFNRNIPEGNIRAVGSCQFEQGEARNHGMVYDGPPKSNSNGWTLIDMPDDVAGGVVWNTIPHSTMGDLIVGNYDFDREGVSANAFIRDFHTHTWQRVALDGLQIVTFYGIWQNGKGSTSYTICGGAKDGLGINQGLLVDYDSATGAFSNQRLYRNPDDAVVITHFEGITLAENGAYHLAAMSDTAALLASVRRLSDGTFGEAIWSAPFDFDGDVTTGNTVYQDVLMGVFQEEGSPIQSYAVTPGRVQMSREHRTG